MVQYTYSFNKDGHGFPGSMSKVVTNPDGELLEKMDTVFEVVKLNVPIERDDLTIMTTDVMTYLDLTGGVLTAGKSIHDTLLDGEKTAAEIVAATLLGPLPKSESTADMLSPEVTDEQGTPASLRQNSD